MLTLTYLEMTRALAEAERVYKACDNEAKEIVSEPLLRESLYNCKHESTKTNSSYLYHPSSTLKASLAPSRPWPLAISHSGSNSSGVDKAVVTRPWWAS